MAVACDGIAINQAGGAQNFDFCSFVFCNSNRTYRSDYLIIGRVLIHHPRRAHTGNGNSELKIFGDHGEHLLTTTTFHTALYYHTMTILLPLLLPLYHLVTVASFTPNHLHPCHQIHREHLLLVDNKKRIFSNAPPPPALQYSLTVEDWHTASQLHPLDNLGVIDDESSSAIIMMGQTNAHTNDSGTLVAGGSTASHPSKTAAGHDDDRIMREFMEAFFPVILLVLLEIYSQQILQFPLA